jgi:hypothetical protein
MALLNGWTDSPTTLGWQFSPCQTYSCENHKTVIRHAADIRAEGKAKLREINKPMKSGTPITSSPNRTATRCRATSLTRFGRTGSLSVVGQKRCAPAQRHYCLSFGPLARARVSRAEATPRTMECRESSFLSARGARARARRARPGTQRPNSAASIHQRAIR